MKPQPAIFILALLLTTGAAFADKPDAASPGSFSVVLLPDTQFYSLRFPEIYLKQTTWVRDSVKPENIKFVAHLGDIVHNNTEQEWKNADRAMRVLDGVVPYSVAPGNHDMATVKKQLTRDTSRFNKYFPPSRYEKQTWYGGHFGETNDSNYCTFTGGGMKFLVLSLEFAPTDQALEWAAKVLKEHPQHRVIVATHCYMRNRARDSSCAAAYRLNGNSGEKMWDKFIRKHANIFLVVSGHVLGTGVQISQNDAGKNVIEMLTDYQGLANGGDGWLRILKFNPQQNRIEVRTYSPKLDQTNTDKAHTFNMDYTMTAPVRK